MLWQALRMLGREDAALLIRPRALPRMLGWSWNFLRNSSLPRYLANVEKNARLADYSLTVLAEHLAPLRGKPMWIGWGLRDFVFDRAFYDEFVRRFPEAEAHAWEDAGHYVMEDARERIVPAVREFLARHPVQEPA